ncbi:hypothetical protein LSH36_127g18066 [Paralvinella palmiformis]|uniref:NUDE domain-containing protein n=1 Tax=Paralvinella palmiformis TaxID=53620 RepID=A0AAD9JWY0_9ANNE|nr:hypothetical protein LSH36_127g18066 [Paralvinella palmiformis]
MESPQFSSTEEQLKYWKSEATQYKERYEEVKEELEEFQISSHELEAELEASLEQTDSKNKELTAAKFRLEMELESLRDKFEKQQALSSKQLTELEDELAQVKAHRDELLKYIRSLEQANDDLERAKRATVTSLEDFEMRLNQAIERNAFLESELDEKETLAITVQRLKDEARDLRQELAVQRHPSSPDIVKSPEKNMDKVDSLVQTELIDSNKLTEELTSTIKTPNATSNIMNTNSGQTPLTPSARISALNIVGDLLRKVGALETKLASCKNFVNNQQPRNSKSGATTPLHSPNSAGWLTFPSLFSSSTPIREHPKDDSEESVV